MLFLAKCERSASGLCFAVVARSARVVMGADMRSETTVGAAVGAAVGGIVAVAAADAATAAAAVPLAEATVSLVVVNKGE